MPYRLTPLLTGEYYHVYNRGVEKRGIFSDQRSRQRLLNTLAYYLVEKPPLRLSQFLHLALPIRLHMTKQIERQSKIVSIVSYCFMPNHIHLLLKQTSDGGVSSYMRHTANSYTKYFNTRYSRVGHLFQGPFKAVRITSDEQLLHVSRYIHLNPLTGNIVNNIDELLLYPWSSFREYITGIAGLANPAPIMDSFGSKESYRSFIANQADYQKDLDHIKHLVFEEK